MSSILICLRTVFAGTVASYNRNHRLLCSNLAAQYGSNFLHNIIASDRTKTLVHIFRLHAELSKRTTTGLTATAAGIAAAIFFGLIMALFFKSDDK
jgi:hypothetical protein